MPEITLTDIFLILHTGLLFLAAVLGFHKGGQR